MAGAGAPFTLPPLPYAYDALEPFIDAQTMQIHHDKHHQAYVDNLNKAAARDDGADRGQRHFSMNSHSLYILIAAALGFFIFSACGASHRLKYFGQVPDFELISQTGIKITLADLKGRVWIADTFFTTCTGPCPLMSAKLQKVEREIGGLANVRVVSFTVDPEHDTQQAMLEYSGHFHAIPDRWFFLTGRQADLNRIAMNGLHLNKVDGSLDHSTEFVLVDADTLIRGYYYPFDQQEFQRLIDDARSLAGA